MAVANQKSSLSENWLRIQLGKLSRGNSILARAAESAFSLKFILVSR